MKHLKRISCTVIALSMVVAMVGSTTSQAKKVPKLTKSSISINVGKSATIKVKNNKKKVKWSSSKKKVATVTKKGKVTGKSAGTATITAKIGKKKLKCKVTVLAVYKSLMVDNFESYAVGTDWANYTLGEGLTADGQEKAHYLAEGETMKVVADPENPQNKVLQVKPKFYSFCPVFTVDLAKLTGVPTKKLGDYKGIRVKVRVVSDATCHVGIGLGSFFSNAGTINKKYAFNTYTVVQKHVEEKEFYKFYHSNGMISGVTALDGQMPQFVGGKHQAGHKFVETDKNVGFATKTLTFNKYLTAPLKGQTTFDFVLGGSYGSANSDYLAWYMDDVELIY